MTENRPLISERSPTYQRAQKGAFDPIEETEAQTIGTLSHLVELERDMIAALLAVRNCRATPATSPTSATTARPCVPSPTITRRWRSATAPRSAIPTTPRTRAVCSRCSPATWSSTAPVSPACSPPEQRASVAG